MSNPSKQGSVPFVVLLFLSMTAFADDGSGNRLAVDKVKGSLSVMVLGSGGPRAAPEGRASSGYLIFVEEEPRILMDVGGGTYKSLAMSGTTVPDVDRILLTHLHLDHTADMSAMVKTIFFHNRADGTFRTAPFHFYGPETNTSYIPPALTGGVFGVTQYPDSSAYVDGHYNIIDGVERYLNVFTRGTDTGILSYDTQDQPSDYTSDTIAPVFTTPDGVVVTSIAVHHGPVPAVAYRIDYNGHSLVWTGDTDSQTDNVAKLAADADLLIYDTAIMADDPLPGTIFHTLHTVPARIGEIAVMANPKTLMLSHITPVTDPRIGEVKSIIRDAGYEGRIRVAEDLKVINLGKMRDE